MFAAIRDYPARISDQAKHPKLIVIMAFDRDEEFQSAFDPLEQQSED